MKNETRYTLTSIAALLAILTLFAPAVFGQTVKKNYVGCLTEESLDEFFDASMNKDYKQMDALLGLSCARLQGLRFSIIDRGFMTSKIRIYYNDTSFVFYVPSEAAD